jgi:steroid delta-isomerase-like uncharacterized protein
MQKTLEIISDYLAALATGNSQEMNALRSPDFVLDFVHGDAFRDKPLSDEETRNFWPVWFAAFPKMDFEVTRTIIAEKVAVAQWTFTGVHAQPLGPPVSDPAIQPRGRAICLRGVSVYDILDGLIWRETTYIDLATLMVELGIQP